MQQDINKKAFTKLLLQWHATTNQRSLPWKNETEPYKIWLSEVILQQTRALQGLPYYNSFTTTYPTITDLANAKDEDVFRLWQGLGYYNRCKNMLATARFIAFDLNGAFPNTHEGIINLKGVGAYTASAIASFAFGLPHAVVDGNVYRVLSRYFGIDTPIDATAGKVQFAALAQSLIDKESVAAYNQAIMDLGATICLPKQAKCQICPLEVKCNATKNGLIDILPVKGKKLTVRTRYFHYVVLIWGNHILLHKRDGTDIWGNLHEPFLIESEINLDKAANGFQKLLEKTGLGINTEIAPSFTSKQRLTHQIIEAAFYPITIYKPLVKIPEGYFWQPIENVSQIAFPKTVLAFLEKKIYL